MKNTLKYAAILAMVAGAAMAATDIPPDNGQEPGNGYKPPDCKMRSCEAPNAKPIVNTAICELPGGYGLMAFADNPALLADIEARLAAGETVMVDVDGTEVTLVSPTGQMHVIGVVSGPGGRSVVCYQSF